jgi:PKD repeat protein
MKKLLAGVSLIFVVSIISGQQVDRNKVLVEIGTGTWCQFCPGAAMGADDLIANGHPVAVIKYHYNDGFANQFSSTRLNYYNISSYPTAKFDGIYTHVGGSTNQSLYTTYLPYVNIRENVPSSFILELFGTSNGSNYNMVAKIYKVASYTGPDPVFHLAVTESDIQFVWQGQTELNNVCRQMVPGATGTAVNFDDSDTVTLNLSFTMGAWVVSHVEFVAFLQNNNSKEVLQAIKIPALFLPPPPMPPVADFEAETTETCEGYEVQYTDLSTQNPNSWSWTFPGGTPETSNERNPVVFYETEGSYDVSLEAANNAGSDLVIKEDYMNVAFMPEQPEISEIDFMLYSSATDGNQWYLNEEIIPDATDQSYQPVENGVYSLTVTQGNCTSEFAAGYEVLWVGIGEEYLSQAIRTYPTPSQGSFTIDFKLQNPDVFSIKVYDAMKTLVYHEENLRIDQPGNKQIDLGTLPDGIYFMLLEGKTNSHLQKLVIRK